MSLCKICLSRTIFFCLQSTNIQILCNGRCVLSQWLSVSFSQKNWRYKVMLCKTDNLMFFTVVNLLLVAVFYLLYWSTLRCIIFSNHYLYFRYTQSLQEIVMSIFKNAHINVAGIKDVIKNIRTLQIEHRKWVHPFAFSVSVSSSWEGRNSLWFWFDPSNPQVKWEFWIFNG